MAYADAIPPTPAAKYKEFWKNLRASTANDGEFKRIAQDGREVGSRTTCNPILDLSGKPVKIVQYAINVSARRVASTPLGATYRIEY